MLEVEINYIVAIFLSLLCLSIGSIDLLTSDSVMCAASKARRYVTYVFYSLKDTYV